MVELAMFNVARYDIMTIIILFREVRINLVRPQKKVRSKEPRITNVFEKIDEVGV